jgi:hypothetical protein
MIRVVVMFHVFFLLYNQHVIVILSKKTDKFGLFLTKQERKKENERKNDVANNC